jgi:hypothetical protein
MKWDSPHIQAKMPDDIATALNAHCTHYGLSRSEAVLTIIAEKFGITYSGGRARALEIIKAKDLEIAELKKQLRLQALKELENDRFTMEEG